MFPKKGDRIKLIFRNGLIEEGIVLEFSNENSAVKSIHDDSILIILNTIQDVQAVKIIKSSIEVKDNKNLDFGELSFKERQELKNKSILELKKEKIKTEKEDARKTIFSGESYLKNVEYAIPSQVNKKPFVGK